MGRESSEGAKKGQSCIGTLIILHHFQCLKLVIRKSKRQRFISTILLGIPSLSFANVLGFRDKKNTGTSNKKGFVVRADESRYHVINPVEYNPGTLITIFQPAQKKVEDFFSYISEREKSRKIQFLIDGKLHTQVRSIFRGCKVVGEDWKLLGRQ
jgi:hypothetical protein